MKAMAGTARRSFITALLIFSFSLGLGACAGSQKAMTLPSGELEPIQLPQPQIDGGKPLMQTLKERQSIRSYTDEKLPLQVLSDLLWAAFGVNRPDLGKRTAPSAMNWQEIDIYVSLQEGLYLYDAKEHRLMPILAEDVRAKTGRIIQPFVGRAPLNLVYVADYSKVSMTGKVAVSKEERLAYAAASTGSISQNVYLYCASEGLGTVVRGLINKSAFAKAAGLRENQEVILAQSVGYPEE